MTLMHKYTLALNWLISMTFMHVVLGTNLGEGKEGSTGTGTTTPHSAAHGTMGFS